MQKTTIKNRLLAALLTLCMVLSLAPMSVFALDPPKPDYLPQGVTYSTDYKHTYHTQVNVTANVFIKDSDGTVVETTQVSKSTEEFLKGGVGALQTALANLKIEIEAPYKAKGTVTSENEAVSSILDHFENATLYTFTPTSGDPVDFSTDLDAAKQYFIEHQDATGVFTQLLDSHEYQKHNYTYDLIVQETSQSESTITAATIENAKFNYQPGDAPKAMAWVAIDDTDKYEIAYECWQQFEGNEPVAAWYSDNGSHGSLPTITKFESGKKYVYSLMLKPKDGYSFSSETVITVNGQKVSAPFVGGSMYIPSIKTITMPTVTVIDVVEINDVTVSFKDGDKPVFTGKVPDGVNYVYRGEWWELDSNTGLISTEPEWGSGIYKNKITTFEAGKTYHYGVYVVAVGYVENENTTYVFGPDTKLKINGKFVNYQRYEGDTSDGSDGTMWVLTDLTMTPEAGGTTPSEKYTVTYTDGRGGTYFADEVHSNLESGTKTPAYNNGVNPTREGYIFKGWTPKVAETVTENVTYTAQWEAKSKHLIKELLSDIKVECVNGDSHTVKEYDTSVGGYSAITLGDKDGKFTSTITVEAKKYLDRYNEDTGETHQLAAGEAETQTIVVEFDSSYDKDSVVVKSGTLPVTFKVTCAQLPPAETYTVTYTDGVDDEEIFEDQTYTVESGEATPDFDGTPARDGYLFTGWEPEVAKTVTGNATYTAQWEQLPPAETYTVTYTDGVDDEELFADQTYTVESGEATPDFNGTPTRDGYLFTGWEPEVAKTVTGNATYTAQWKQLPPAETYTVTYTDGVDDEEIFEDQTYTVESGEATPDFNGTPTREGYTFVGWEPAVAEYVTEDAIYEATWTSDPTTPSKDKSKTDKTTSSKTGKTASPKTGDTSNVPLWFALLFVSGGAAIGTTVVIKKKKYHR